MVVSQSHQTSTTPRPIAWFPSRLELQIVPQLRNEHPNRSDIVHFGKSSSQIVFGLISTCVKTQDSYFHDDDEDDDDDGGDDGVVDDDDDDDDLIMMIMTIIIITILLLLWWWLLFIIIIIQWYT